MLRIHRIQYKYSSSSGPQLNLHHAPASYLSMGGASRINRAPPFMIDFAVQAFAIARFLRLGCRKGSREGS